MALRRLAAAVVVIAGLAIAVIVLRGDDGDDEAIVRGPSGHDFSLVRPDAWEEVPDDERESLAGNALLVMRRGEGEGLLVVEAPSDTERDLNKVAKTLDRELAKSLPDFRKAGARVVQVKAGTALLYSYARGRRATAHTILVVPTRERTYTINAVIPAGADAAAREVGTMLRSFDL